MRNPINIFNFGKPIIGEPIYLQNVRQLTKDYDREASR